MDDELTRSEMYISAPVGSESTTVRSLKKGNEKYYILYDKKNKAQVVKKIGALK